MRHGLLKSKHLLLMADVRAFVAACVAVCCSLLQSVAVCCSLLQSVAVCCGVLRCVAVPLQAQLLPLMADVRTFVAVCCSTLQPVAV